jgi:hypothetical protein
MLTAAKCDNVVNTTAVWRKTELCARFDGRRLLAGTAPYELIETESTIQKCSRGVATHGLRLTGTVEAGRGEHFRRV